MALMKAEKWTSVLGGTGFGFSFCNGIRDLEGWTMAYSDRRGRWRTFAITSISRNPFQANCRMIHQEQYPNEDVEAWHEARELQKSLGNQPTPSRVSKWL